MVFSLKWASLYLISCISISTLSGQDIFSEELLEIHLEFEDANWREVLLNARNTGDNRRLAARVTINNTTYPDVQVRFKGNSSFYGAVKAGLKKIPLNLKAPDEHPFAGGYETLKLANNYRDPSAVRELLAYQIASDYVPVPQSTYAIVYVKDEYLGVYTATEGVTASMSNRYFCGTKKGLVQGEPDFKRSTPTGCTRGNYSSLEYLGDHPHCYAGLYEVKDTSEWQHLIRLARVLNDSSEMLEEVLDVHMALWMHAINNVLVNLDSYLGFFCHNYYLYRDYNDIYHPLLWDLNLAFGGFHVLKEGVDVDFATLSPIVHERYNLKNRPLITELLKDRLYRRLYFSMMRTIIDEWFANGRYLEVAEILQNRIRPYIGMENGTFYNTTDFERNLSVAVKAGARSVPGIEELMIARVDYLSVHPLLKPNVLAVDNWQAGESTDSTEIIIHTSGGVTTARIWYRNSVCTSYRPLAMNTIALTADFACHVPGRPASFYFELDGEGSANLWPLNAPRKTIEIRR
ncbi:MAG TPA: CotH kinase family protein [Saprospiraceae bacterium]|nr:CotH kinase family protein [Saprospiraceae bacterium]